MSLEVQTSSPFSSRELQYGNDLLRCIERSKQLGPIEVAPTLRGAHKLVSVTRQELEYQRRMRNVAWIDRPSRKESEIPSTLAIEVGDELENRALRIMDALIKRIEAIGGCIEIKKDKYYGHREYTALTVANEEPLSIRLREKYVRIEPPKNAKSSQSYEFNRNLAPSGCLMFDHGPSSIDKPLLLETKQKPLESKLNWLVLALLTRIGESRIRRLERAEEEHRRQEAARIERERQEAIRKKREDLHRRQSEEQGKVNELITHANSWRQAQHIRDYLDALTAHFAPLRTSIPIKCSLADYLRWGFGQAARMDPLREGPPSVLDETIEEPAWLPNKPR